MARYHVPPGYLLSLAIVTTLSKRDPRFLKDLRAELQQLLVTRRGEKDAEQVISAFLSLLDDPKPHLR
jgi:hypothetical protein